jgi:hypothetical protein
MPPVSDKWRLRKANWERLCRDPIHLAALRLVRDVKKHDIQLAAAAFGLDPNNNTDRDVLLGILANIMFHKIHNALDPEFKFPKKTIRKDQWTSERVRTLRADAIQASQRPPVLHFNAKNLPKIAARLTKPKQYGPFIGDYSKKEPSTLARYLRYRRAEQESSKGR